MAARVMVAWPSSAEPQLIVESDGVQCDAMLLGVVEPRALSKAARAALSAALVWGRRPVDAPPPGWCLYVPVAERLH